VSRANYTRSIAGGGVDLCQRRSRADAEAEPSILSKEDPYVQEHAYPTDSSTLSKKAIKAGIALAKSTGARVTGFYSPEPYEILAYGEYFPPDLMSRAEWDERSKKTAQKFRAKELR
jgi:nucleotide-binding universal stress UspA family protein